MCMALKAEKRGRKEKSTNPIPHLANKYTDDKCCFFLSITTEGGREGGLLCAATVDGQTDRLRLYLGLRRRLPNGVVALFYGQVGIWTDGLELGREEGGRE